MKIDLDENLPLALVASLASLGHDVDTVPSEGLAGVDDSQVWAATQSESCLLITQDLDFSDIRRFSPGSHNGILLVRLNSPSWSHLVKHVQMIFETEDIEAWQGAFVVSTESKLRVHLPPASPGSN